MTRIKICGLRTPADIAAANESRPDYIGFILSPGYRRSITKEQALALRKQLDPGIVPVGVFVNAAPAYIQACVDCGAIEAVQFHGQESPADCAAIHGAKKSRSLSPARTNRRHRAAIRWTTCCLTAGEAMALPPKTDRSPLVTDRFSWPGG